MNSDKKWLLKSSDSIHGPFEFDTVVENIFNGDVHLLDEIKGPLERWRPIKDHSLFAAAIEKLKASTYQQREETLTATVDLGTKTHELTRSQTVSLPDDSETKTPLPLPDDDFDKPMPSKPSQPTTYRSYTPRERGLVKAKKRKSPTAFIVTFLALIVAGAVYLVLDFNRNRIIEQKITAYDQLTDVALDALRVGEYQRALRNFTTAYNISPNDPNLLIEMSPLSVQFEGQFDQVQANLERLIVNTRQQAVKKLAHNIIGLSYSYRERYTEALLSYDRALQIDEKFLPARLNRAQVLLKTKKFEQAVALMAEVVAGSPEEAIAHFFYVRSLVQKGLVNNSQNLLKEALSVSDQYSQKFSDFRQEVLFLMAVVEGQLGAEVEPLVSMVNNFLRVDFELTRLHVHDTSIDFQSFNWVDFYPLCKNLSERLPDYNKKMLNGFCLLKIGRTLEAKKLFENLLSENNRDGILQALYASVLLKLNDVSQAKNALSYIDQVDQKQPLVETILRGCLIAGEVSCAQAIFNGSHAKRISLLYSHWGNSEINREKEPATSRRSVYLGLGISPNFAPLLKLQREL